MIYNNHNKTDMSHTIISAPQMLSSGGIIMFGEDPGVLYDEEMINELTK